MFAEVSPFILASAYTRILLFALAPNSLIVTIVSLSCAQGSGEFAYHLVGMTHHKLG